MRVSRLLGLVAATIGLTVPTSAAAGWTTFSTGVPQPIGVACVGDGAGGITDRLVVISYYNNGVTGGLYTIDETGAATRRTVSGLPTWNSIEVYLAVSPGLGEWETGLVYLVKGGDVYEVSADLSTATRIVSISGAPATHSGITFDRTGVWDHDMIVTLMDGRAYRVHKSVSGGSASYTTTYLGTNGGQQHESPRVITDDPAKWGNYAGCVTTSSETAHRVYAFCPDTASATGVSVSTLASSVTNAEAADLRPSTGETTFGGTSYVYFLSAFNYGQIVAYTAADLPSGSEGDLFVSREYTGGIHRITGPSAGSTFAGGLSEHYEGSNFCFAAQTIDTAEDCTNGTDDDNDGNADGADADCWVCGDGDVDTSSGEECDDGNVVSGDGCDSDCLDEAPPDDDGDGVPDDDDLCEGHDDNADADLDLVPDGCDDCDEDPDNDADGDGVCGDVDACEGYDDTLDDDGDGLPNDCDGCPDDAANDADADGVCGDVDTCPGHDDTADADADLLADGCDDCDFDADNDADNDGVCGDVDACPGFDDLVDTDSDGLADGCDACPNDAANDADADGVCGDVDACEGWDDGADADGDDVPDACDTCPYDAENDADGDGVCGDEDLCVGTTLPESVPTVRLGTNRWADTDGDGDFDTTSSGGTGPGRAYTIEDTQGCSCSQIIATCGYGDGHTKHGCSISVMDAWVAGEPYCH